MMHKEGWQTGTGHLEGGMRGGKMERGREGGKRGEKETEKEERGKKGEIETDAEE